MANVQTFPTLGDLNAVESLLLMCLIEYMDAIAPRLEPLIRVIGTREPTLLQEAVQALRKEKFNLSLQHYNLEGAADNTIRQYFTNLKYIDTSGEQRVLTTFFDAKSVVDANLALIPVNLEVVVGTAINNIVNCNRRQVGFNRDLEFSIVKTLRGELSLKTLTTQYITVQIGDA